ncbi:MHYT domain-containing protein [Thetidibacter halocola]|uniref:LytTR family transcriptional regulator DNA-binding domain-containing protein n=1 Tax=Thetidibacter halocola TaxID=2827239 RepID=A0A8J7WF57_9RHOB|nr:MHYT domain-containing protein [Thetidibacter halocola]MBS0125249.1 LytTR family transcriptional regulator DNA-binding domain-containing protein [Thetidibacter halocola]
MLDYSHNWLFALAALAIALIAGFSGLSLMQGASHMRVPMRRAVVSVAAVILGWGVWSMHFVAMLGLDLPLVFYFDPLVTLISALTAILMMGLALLIVHEGRRTRRKVVLGGTVTGLGIATMHYIGMAGMEVCRPVYSASGIAVALAASVALSVLSFLISYEERRPRNILIGTLGFGLAVCAVHFIAMAGTGFVATGETMPAVPMSREVLAFGVAVSAFVLSGAFLLSGASFASRLGDADAGGGMALALAGGAPPPLADAPRPYAAVPAPARSAPAPAEKAAAPRAIPYEADGRTRFLAPEEIAAIRAEGHYTLLYTDGGRHFCPWSITQAAARVPAGLFVQTHRSYLVNVDHVTSFERRKDNGICFFENTQGLGKVPVSRSRLSEVRERLGM